MKIEINNIVHTYDVNVLKNLQLTLEGYNSVAIIGVSGSGKSTLIRLMSGLETPTSGNIIINNEEVLSSEYKKRVGFVFQNHNLFPHLSLLKNITIVLEKTRGYSKEKAKETALKYLKLLKL